MPNSFRPTVSGGGLRAGIRRLSTAFKSRVVIGAERVRGMVVGGIKIKKVFQFQKSNLRTL
jgi:hypothetical protein